MDQDGLVRYFDKLGGPSHSRLTGWKLQLGPPIS